MPGAQAAKHAYRQKRRKEAAELAAAKEKAELNKKWDFSAEYMNKLGELSTNVTDLKNFKRFEQLESNPEYQKNIKEVQTLKNQLEKIRTENQQKISSYASNLTVGFVRDLSFENGFSKDNNDIYIHFMFT